MAKFYYKVIGTADDGHSAGTLEAEDKDQALVKLRETYVGANTPENQPAAVKYELITEKQFEAIESDRGQDATHFIA